LIDSISENEIAWFLVHGYKKPGLPPDDDFDLWLKNPDLTEAESTDDVTREDIKKLILAAEIYTSSEDVSKYLSLLESQTDYKINHNFFEFLTEIFYRHNRIVWSDWKFNTIDFLSNFKKVLVDF